MIHLRPHHLLCVHGWRGHGYSPEFTDNFNKISARLSAGATVVLVQGEDDICRCCPKNNCVMPARAIDERLVERVKLEIGRTYRVQALLELIKEQIVPKDLETICDGCEWFKYGWCVEAVSAL